MTPLLFVWPYALVFWLIYIAAYWEESAIVRRAQKSAKQAGSLDAGSCRVIMLGMGFASLVAFPLAWIGPLRFAAPLQVPMFAFGVIAVAAGALIRKRCFRLLGDAFTGDVQVQPGQKIVNTGPYALLRHPAYTGGSLMNVGIALALGSWASLALLLVASFAVYSYRIAVEESALLAELGEPYREFLATRKRIIPYIW
jgi:protein-S-isoprenylcysteine O-methyltransferase Ste14